MGGILGWLDKFFTSAASSAVSTYLNIVHWAVRGITSLVFGQFGNTSRAWTVYYTDNIYFTEQVKVFTTASKNAHGYTLRVRIPRIIRWSLGNFFHLKSGIAALTRLLLHLAAVLRALITSTAKALTRWVLRTVWAPLYAYYRKVRADLLKWGYTAWWWITHLDKLAGAMIFHLAIALEHNAWALAGMLGKFTLALVLRNAKRLSLLVEQIVTAVI